MWKVAALYRFVEIKDVPATQAALKEVCLENGACGTILIAPEGINGTFAAMPEALDRIIDWLDKTLEVSKGELKYSTATEKPFLRMKVRQKKEIITMRAPEANPNKTVGTYLTPQEWNELLEDPEVVLLDTRNKYETACGVFEGAIDPEIDKFTEFKDYVQDNLDPAKHKKIAMYCTGGIRCEKASSYMMAHGFDEVYHLHGGILKYLGTIPADQSKWEGSCFVFDKRVAIDHGLKESPHKLCYGCRMPLSEEETQLPSYELGVSCLHCHDNLTEERKAALRHRQQQFAREEQLAADSSKGSSADQDQSEAVRAH